MVTATHQEDTRPETSIRPSKRVRFSQDVKDDDREPVDTPSSSSVYSHESYTNPFGLEPLGNYYLLPAETKPTRTSLGPFLSKWHDELIVEFLTNYLPPAALGTLSRASRACYVFCYFDDIWRSKVLDALSGEFLFKDGSWRNTFKHHQAPNRYIRDTPIQIPYMYSDLLYTAWRCTAVPLDSLCGLQRCNVDRRSGPLLSVQEFMTHYGSVNRPVILTDIVTKWPAFLKWNYDYLLKACGSRTMKAEAVDITLPKYLEYVKSCREEAPLYLFDKGFANGSILADDYAVPEYFQSDLFQVLGNERPDYRWLIIGPTRSGSSFHIDPNATSAWNAVISGRKKWILFPPEVIPPGVFPSSDGSQVTSPVTLTEWFMNYYQELKRLPASQRPLECICEAGEILFVPQGWWHCVMNLEDTIAITQNFVLDDEQGRCLKQVLTFLKNKPDQVSGWYGQEPLFDAFVKQLEPDRVNPVLEEMQREEDEIKNAEKVVFHKQERGLWSDLLASSNNDVSEPGVIF